jgi:hypothetical protein
MGVRGDIFADHRSLAPPTRRRLNMSFALYMLGFAILLVGVAWGLITAGVPQIWVIIASLVMLGLGIMAGVTRTKPKDPQS